MELYSILAWLPGEITFYALDPTGQVGLLSPNGFANTNAHYVDSAILKWGFKDLRPLKITASTGQLKNLAEHLASLSL
jgi:hypothetical protein